MRITVSLLVGLVLGLIVGQLALTLRLNDLAVENEILQSRIRFTENEIVNRTNQVQDALEERIGTLERDTGDLKFILGGGK